MTAIPAPEQYLSDLLAAGLSAAQLTDSDVAAVRSGCLSLLAHNAETLVGAESGSVRVETAAALLASVSYVIGTTLRAYPTEADAVSALKTVPTTELYAKGQRRIQQKLQAARILHRRLRRHLFATPNVFYRATAVDAIDGFFKLYRPELFAQERHITADYPTFFGLPPLWGIDFIAQYQKDIAFENRFCRSFSPPCVDRLLRAQHPQYAQTVMNLYTPVLSAALGCVLTAQPIRLLHYDRNALHERLATLPADAVRKAYADAALRLCTLLDCSEGLARYVQKSTAQIADLYIKTRTVN